MRLKSLLKFLPVLLFLLVLSVVASASDSQTSNLSKHVINDQRYNKAIHIMVMRVVGFGFVMVFVRKYGRSV